MGSSEPLPAGFEIRFGSLNFQATANDYLMRITNRDELHPWRSTGPGPVPVTLAVDAPTPQHRDADDAPASALDRRRWKDVRLRVSPHNATRPSARQHPHPQGSAQFSSRGSPTGCVTPRRRTPHPPAPTWRRTRIFPATTSWRSGTPSPPPMTSPTTAPPVSYHLPLHIGTRSGTSPACRTR
jgi:hypothetical protein